MTTNELIEYYKNLLIIQYNNKPNARATVDAFVRATVADQIISTVRDGFDLNTAVGQELDFLSAYRGVSRDVVGLNPNRSYFSMPAYADGDIGTVKGFAVYPNLDNNITWYFLQYSDTNAVLYQLTDDEVRRLTQFRAAVHSCDYSYKALDKILFNFFGANVDLQETGNMALTYHHNIADTDLLFTVIQQTNSLPRPAGMSVAVTIS